jgi:hypothetical protein
MSRQIVLSDKFKYNTENGNRIYEAEIEVPKNFKRKVARLVPHYEEFEIYNAGGMTETRQYGYECSNCKTQYCEQTVKYCAKCGAELKGENK